MSLLPLLLHELVHNNYWPRMIRPRFGSFIEPTAALRRELQNLNENFDGDAEITSDKNKFEIKLDVQQYAPKEITVKSVDDSIVVEGKHEKKDENGFIARHFSRSYILPNGIDFKNIVSSLSADGVLTVTAPKLATEEKANERTIPVTQTGPTKPLEENDK